MSAQVKTLKMPAYIYCPKCGGRMRFIQATPEEKKAIVKNGYVNGARYVCSCGVVALLLVKPLPESPTFTLMFDIYKR